MPLDKLSSVSLAWCQRIGSTAATVSEARNDVVVLDAIQQSINRVNEAAVSHAQHIQKWAVLPRDFTVAGGELGALLQLAYISVTDYYYNKVPFSSSVQMQNRPQNIVLHCYNWFETKLNRMNCNRKMKLKNWFSSGLCIKWAVTSKLEPHLRSLLLDMVTYTCIYTNIDTYIYNAHSGKTRGLNLGRDSSPPLTFHPWYSHIFVLKSDVKHQPTNLVLAKAGV